MLQKQWLKIRAMEKGQLLIEGTEEEIIEKIKKSEAKDDEVVKVVEEIKKAGVKVLRNNKQQIEDKLVLKEEKVYVLKDESLRLEIIQLHHDMPIVGHGGQYKIVELVIRNYWWPGVTKEMKQYVERYDQCERIKNRAEMPVEKLRPNAVPEKLQQHILVDLITKLLVSRGHDLILVICNRFLKMSHFIAMTEKMTVEGLAKLFRNNKQKLYRLLESVISDREPQFVAGLMKELNKMLRIEMKLSTAFYSQTDRQTERTN